MMYIALIERDDGTTYEQFYKEFEDLLDLLDSLGEGYKVCAIY